MINWLNLMAGIFYIFFLYAGYHMKTFVYESKYWRIFGQNLLKFFKRKVFKKSQKKSNKHSYINQLHHNLCDINFAIIFFFNFIYLEKFSLSFISSILHHKMHTMQVLLNPQKEEIALQTIKNKKLRVNHKDFNDINAFMVACWNN